MDRSFFFDNRPFVYILSGIIGYLLGIWLVFHNLSFDTVTLGLDASGHLIEVGRVQQDGVERLVSPTRDFLNWHPTCMQWGFWLALLMAFACAILVPAALLNLKIIKDFSLMAKAGRRWVYLLLIVLLGGCFLWVTKPINDAILIPDEVFVRLKLLYYKHVGLQFWLTRLIVLSGLLCFLGIFLLNMVVVDRNAQKGSDEEIEPAIQAELERYFRFFANSVGVLITGAVLASSFLRELVYSVVKPASPAVAQTAAWKALAPAEVVVLFGLNQMVFLMALLIPTFYFLHRSGQLALKRIQLKSPEAGKGSALALSPQAMMLRHLWLWALIVSPLVVLLFSKVSAFVANML